MANKKEIILNSHDYAPRPDHGFWGFSGNFSRMTLTLTTRCITNCIFCARKDLARHGTVSYEDMEALVARVGDFRVTISFGAEGDSLTLDDLPERIRLLKAAWPEATFILPAPLNHPRSKRFFEEIIDAGLNAIHLSCYGFSKNEYQTIHGVDRFSAVCLNIETLPQAKNISKILLCCMAFSNLKEQYGIEVSPKNHAEFKQKIAIHGFNNSIEIRLNDWCGRTRAKQISSVPRVAPYPCSVVWGYRAGYLNVNWNLDVVPCCFTFYGGPVWGNLKTSSIEEIYCSEAYQTLYRRLLDRQTADMPFCSACEQPNHYPSQEECERLAAYEDARLAGQEVYFWGWGETYRRYRSLFARTKPKAILLDADYIQAEHVDGIPVKTLDEALLGHKKLPIIVFARLEYTRGIVERIISNYSRYEVNDLVLAIASVWPAANIIPLSPTEAH